MTFMRVHGLFENKIKHENTPITQQGAQITSPSIFLHSIELVSSLAAPRPSTAARVLSGCWCATPEGAARKVHAFKVLYIPVSIASRQNRLRMYLFRRHLSQACNLHRPAMNRPARPTGLEINPRGGAQMHTFPVRTKRKLSSRSE